MDPKRKLVANKENALTSSAKKAKSLDENVNDGVVFLDTENKDIERLVSSNLTPQRLGDLSNKFNVLAAKQVELASNKNQKSLNFASTRANISLKEIEEDLIELVDKIKSSKHPGEYSVDGEANELPTLLDLNVKDYGPVSPPLVEAQAKELINVCQQAPYGRNMDTLIDTNVRDSYQLDPEQVEIGHPEWSAKLQVLVNRVGKALGCQNKIEAKLYKVLIYKPGGHFVKHRDSEKDKKMFGTLIIQPPSTHTGGELVVYEANGKSNKVIDFGQKENKSKFSVQFAAHYADLEHELLEVKSGYRLALVYSLCWLTGNGHLMINKNSSLANEISTILEKLNDQPYQLGLLMEHQYTPQSFQTNGFRCLKGKDNDRYNVLSQANELLAPEKQLKMYMCHASLVIERYDVSGYYNARGYIDPKYKHYKWDESGRNYSLRNWYDSDGTPVFNSSRFDLNLFTKIFDMSRNYTNPVSLMQEDDWGKYINEEFDGYLGNEGVNKTTTYSKYVLVVWPKSFELDILAKIDINCAIDSFHKSIVVDSVGDYNKFRSVLEKIDILNDRRNLLSGASINKILEILLKINDFELTQLFLFKIKPSITLKNSSIFVKLIIQFNSEKIIELVKSSIVKLSPVWLIQNCYFIQALYKEKQTESLAFELVNKCVIDLINTPSLLSNIMNLAKDDPYKISHTWSMVWRKDPDEEPDNFRIGIDHVFVIIAKTLNLFPKEITSSAFKEFTSAILKSINQDNQFVNLVADFNRSVELKSCEPIMSMFEERKKWLQEKLLHMPVFSWNMVDAKLPGHPTVEAFLQGDQEKMIYSGAFKYVRDLRQFIRQFSDSMYWSSNRNFSVEMVEMPGKSVLIKKTRKIHEEHLKKLNSYAKELENINNFLK